MEIELTKINITKKSILAIIGILLIYLLFFLNPSLSDEEIDALHPIILTDYMRYQMERTDINNQQKQQGLRALATATFQFEELSVRGYWKNTLVRVELKHSPNHPPEMPFVHYYKISKSPLDKRYSAIHSRFVTYYSRFF